jgi:glycosyltransferase involved in cell wall biosynthesis
VRIDDYFHTAIRSLLAQTYPALEIIVVLDGIKWPSGEPWMGDARIRVETLDYRLGTPGALNHGASLARGKYIARLDADDVADPERISEQIKILEAEPNLLCLGSAVRLIDDSGNVIGHLAAPRGADNVAAGLLVRNQFVHSSVVYRTDAFRSVAGYNPMCKRMQDYELFLRLALKGDLDNCPLELTSYRVHPGQHSRNSSPWDLYTREVLHARSALARAQGANPAVQAMRNITWFVAQVARHYRLRSPGYLRPSKTGIRPRNGFSKP